jgi:hypothetical protein
MRWIMLSAVLLGALFACAQTPFGQPGPERTLAELREAMAAGDVEEVRTMVDIEAIAGQGVDVLVADPVGEFFVPRADEPFSDLGRLLGLGVTAVIERQLVKEAVEGFASCVETGRLHGVECGPGDVFGSSARDDVFWGLERIESKSGSAGDNGELREAVAYIRVAPSRFDVDHLGEFVMRGRDNDWRIVEWRNIAEFGEQIGEDIDKRPKKEKKTEPQVIMENNPKLEVNTSG